MTSQPDDPKARLAETDGRRQAEQDAISELLERVPPNDQAVARAALENYFESVRGVDFDAARQKALADQEARFPGRSAAIREARLHDRGMVRVTVALVPDLELPEIRATVIRRPNDGGRPLVLLRESDATEQDLAIGLRAAAISFQKYGVSPSREYKFALRAQPGQPNPAPRRAGVRSELDLLRSSQVREVAGLGPAKAMQLITRFKNE